MIRTILLFLALGLPLLPQINEEHPGHHDTGNIPFEFIKNKVIISVEIEGTSYKFLLDTGGVFEISQELQNKMQFEEDGEANISDINKQKVNLEMVLVPQIKIGKWKFINRTAIVTDMTDKFPYSCFGLDGMIGRDFFGRALLHLDASKKICRLTQNPAALKLSTAHRTNLRISNRGLPDVLLTINGRKEYVEFDSGSGDFFSYKTKTAKKKTFENSEDKLAFTGIFSFGATMKSIPTNTRYRIKLDELKMAKTTFSDFYSDFSKLTASRIGAGILHYGAVTVDYRHLSFYFVPFSDAQPAHHYDSFGFDIAKITGPYIIKWVLEGSEADKAGIRSGDIVHKINDIAVEEVAKGCEGYLNGYAFKEWDQVKLDITDASGKARSIQLEKQRWGKK